MPHRSSHDITKIKIFIGGTIFAPGGCSYIEGGGGSCRTIELLKIRTLEHWNIGTKGWFMSLEKMGYACGE